MQTKGLVGGREEKDIKFWSMKSPSQRLRGRGRGNLLSSAALMWCSGPGIPFRGMCVADGPARPLVCPGALPGAPSHTSSPAAAFGAAEMFSRKTQPARFSTGGMGSQNS